MYYNTRIEITLYDEDMERLNNPELEMIKKGDITILKGHPRTERKKGK